MPLFVPWRGVSGGGGVVRKLFVGFTIFLALCHAATAATLSGVQGQVLVNQGNGFVQAQPGMTISPGDTVMVSEGATAQVTYPNGVVANVPPGGLFTVPTVPPAAPAAAAAAGGTGLGAGLTTGIVVAGAVAGAAGIGLLVSNATKEEKKPSSP